MWRSRQGNPCAQREGVPDTVEGLQEEHWGWSEKEQCSERR